MKSRNEWIEKSNLDSLDQVDRIMAVEAELNFDFGPDDLWARPRTTTFRELVLAHARARRAA